VVVLKLPEVVDGRGQRAEVGARADHETLRLGERENQSQGLMVSRSAFVLGIHAGGVLAVRALASGYLMSFLGQEALAETLEPVRGR